MDEKAFKDLFSTISKSKNFSKYSNIWYKQTEETIVTLSFQKSRFGNYLDLNVKVFIQGLFNRSYQLSKEISRDTGDIFRRQPEIYESLFDLDREVKENKLKEELETFFDKFVCPLTDTMSSKNSIIEYYKENPDKFLLPAVKKELGL